MRPIRCVPRGRIAPVDTASAKLVEHWNEEQRSAFLYRVCAESEAGNTRGTLFARLAEEALAQARIWERTLADRGGHVPAFDP